MKSVPIRNFKNTGEFLAFVESEPEPVSVTKNGTEALVVMTPAEYDRMRLEIARGELYAMVLQDEADITAGNYVDGDEFFAEVRKEYGLS